MRTILITGFGPFPGAPYNPTPALVQRLARRGRPGLRLIAHVFPTSYAAVDRDLPALIKRHRPDALLMFGLHGRAKTLRVETRARNMLGRSRDAGGATPKSRLIDAGAPAFVPLPVPARRLAAVARAVTSRDAGAYLCNYLCWHAAAVRGPRLAAFVHVPPVARKTLPKGNAALTEAKLLRAGEAILGEAVRCLGPAGNRP